MWRPYVHPKNQTARTRTLRIGSAMVEVHMTPRAIAAFIEYRDMGPGRSVRRLVEGSRSRTDPMKRYSKVSAEKWSRKYGWLKLVRDYDMHLAEESAVLTHRKRLEEIEKDRLDRLTTAKLAMHKGYAALLNKSPEVISTANAVKLIEFAITIQRADRETALAALPGEAGVSQDLDGARLKDAFERMTDDEKQEFLRVFATYQDARERLRAYAGDGDGE